ncbi:MAG: ribbon-helix-helix domain-containing protein [Patescibacteria group bacterium]|nr:MAG: ribbon-helix-helix domain-containing protein [Patescibacteria group bacterium]
MKHISKFTTVSIPAPLFRKLERLIKGTGFPSVSSFATFVMREIVLGQEGGAPFSTEDKDKIVKRLKELGYI